MVVDTPTVWKVSLLRNATSTATVADSFARTANNKNVPLGNHDFTEARIIENDGFDETICCETQMCR